MVVVVYVNSELERDYPELVSAVMAVLGSGSGVAVSGSAGSAGFVDSLVWEVLDWPLWYGGLFGAGGEEDAVLEKDWFVKFDRGAVQEAVFAGGVAGAVADAVEGVMRADFERGGVGVSGVVYNYAFWLVVWRVLSWELWLPRAERAGAVGGLGLDLDGEDYVRELEDPSNMYVLFEEV